MKIGERLQNVKRLFLDTAPLVYYVEQNNQYVSRVDPVFERLDAGALTVVVSPITLAECLVAPIRKGQDTIVQAFTDLMLTGEHVEFTAIDGGIAQKAAALRAQYNLALPDAFQVAIALAVGCDAFLTNDLLLERVTELNVMVLDKMEISS